ncbi:MAG: archease [Actinomycetota bacterium]
MSGYEILEHTADVGLRATGATIEECFEQATRGLAYIAGIDRPGAGERIDILLESDDLGALLVDWLSEVLYLHDARDALLAGVEISEVAGGRVSGSVTLTPRAEEAVEGTQVKAVTYHKLRIGRTPGGFLAEVYLDV